MLAESISCGPRAGGGLLTAGFYFPRFCITIAEVVEQLLVKSSDRHFAGASLFWFRPIQTRPSLRTFAVVVFLATVSLCGHSASAQSAEKTETIRGTVVNSVTHEPIARAQVYSPDNRFATLTDTEGRFEFTFSQSDSGPGAETITSNRPNLLLARKVGFLTDPAYAPQSLPFNGPAKELTLSLVPEALIVGRVSLPTSEAPDRIQVELYRRLVRDGRAHWALAGNATSKSTGEFRFADLTAGTYKVLTRELLDRDPLTTDPRGQLYGYPPVYYPVAPGFSSAGEIRLMAGETAQANLTLVRQPYYDVKIPVANAQPATGVGVNVFLAGQRGPGYALAYNARDQSIEGMLPNGTYTIEASSFGPAYSVMAGELDFTVHSTPVAGPVMVLMQGRSVSVTVTEEFTSGPGGGAIGPGFSPGTSGGARRWEPRGPRRYLNVMLEPVDDFGQERGAYLRPPTAPSDDSLVMENVRPGRYWATVTSSRGFAAAIHSGANDLRQKPLEIGAGGAVAPIEVTMRDDTGEIDGTIEGITPSPPTPLNAAVATDAMASVGITVAPAAPAHVYCIPLMDSGGIFTEVWVSPDGSFQSPPLAPGAYRLLAFDRSQPELEYRNSEAVRAYDAKGPVVRLAAGQKEHVRLQLITPE